MNPEQKASLSESVFPLEVHKMQVSKDGVENFFWPVSYAERERFLAQLMDGYFDLVEKYEETDSALYYKLIGKYVMAETLGIFVGDLVHARARKAGVRFELPETAKVWPLLFSEKTPAPPPFLYKLAQSPSAKSAQDFFSVARFQRIFKRLKFSQKGLGIDHLKIKPITRQVLEDDVIALQRDGTILAHVQMVERDVVFCRSQRWFKPVSERELFAVQEQDLDSDFVTGFVGLMENLYRDFDIELQRYSGAYFESFLRTGLSILRVHYGRLLEAPEALPKTVWSGSAGNIWDVMVRLAVMHRGGEAVGHDHGAGLAHVDNPMMGFSEFWGCQEFVAFNENQAAELNKNKGKWRCFAFEPPTVTGISKDISKQSITKVPRFDVDDYKIKKIFFITTIYDDERCRLGPSSPGIVHVDWQARLISHLRSWGYEIILKLHPESPVMPPKVFENMGAEVMTDPFEVVMDQADMVLFDSVYSTTFRSVLSTNIPVALIDFYNHPWTEKARGLLEKRCSFMEGRFDEQNRKQVDWGALQNAIERSVELNDHTGFFDYYYE
ncbi:MAG: hypothetical protein R3E13_01965 [Alphaproteobacteria bacterium]